MGLTLLSCRFYNNIASNCADPSRADYFPDWCNEFQSLCKRFRNATGAEKQKIRDDGTYFLGAPLDVPCNTWNGVCMSSLVLNLCCTCHVTVGASCDFQGVLFWRMQVAQLDTEVGFCFRTCCRRWHSRAHGLQQILQQPVQCWRLVRVAKSSAVL